MTETRRGNGGRPRRGLTAREQVGVVGALPGWLAGYGSGLLVVALSVAAEVLLVAAIVGYVVLIVRMRRRGRRVDRERDDWRA